MVGKGKMAGPGRGKTAGSDVVKMATLGSREGMNKSTAGETADSSFLL